MITKIIKLTVGDWSNDGHGISGDFYFQLSSEKPFPVGNIPGILKKTSKELGFDYINLCSDYDDSFIPKEVFESTLIQLGFSESEFESLAYYHPDKERYALEPQMWVDLLVLFIKYYAKNNGYDIYLYPMEVDLSMIVGGYGLYSQ